MHTKKASLHIFIPLLCTCSFTLMKLKSTQRDTHRRRRGGGGGGGGGQPLTLYSSPSHSSFQRDLILNSVVNRVS